MKQHEYKTENPTLFRYISKNKKPHFPILVLGKYDIFTFKPFLCNYQMRQFLALADFFLIFIIYNFVGKHIVQQYLKFPNLSFLINEGS